ncbi:sensor histidine kinase [Stackebrandtia soli]|uniref:sensor histidine kinase n=1 Tax=Stackebrandtia soli TaxID=1892856 RepID=UPI0039E76D0D
MPSSSQPPPVRSWLLPGELAGGEVAIGVRRTARDWLVDVMLFAFAVLIWFEQVENYPGPYDPETPSWMLAIDPWIGAVACLALWWRRRFPLALMIFMIVVLIVSASGTGAVMVAVLTLAVHRDWWIAGLGCAVCLGIVVPYGFLAHPPEFPPWMFAGICALMFVVPLMIGMTVRARRQLMVSLRRDTERQREEHRLRLANVRRAERQQIAREMHDVLAHRLSLLSVHAGALAYRNERARAGSAVALRPEEVDSAITVIRDNAAIALSELGEVLTVLRDDGADSETTRPQP